MSRITIRDIAKLLKVNPSTVSRALKDHPDIGLAMKAKIKQVASDLGYQPNFQAIHFRQRKSKMVALILPEIENFFTPDMIKAIEEMTKKHGYNLIIFQSNELLEKEKESITLCQNFGIDGLLVSVSKETKDIAHFNILSKTNTPIVFVDKVIHTIENASVSINDFNAAFVAVNYLAGRKYKKIAGVFANKNLEITQQRKLGFKAGLEKHKLTYIENLCFFANSKEEAKVEFSKLLAQKITPDAVFIMTDSLLTAVIQVIHEKQLSIPNDIAVICISNGNLPYYFHPKITYIKHSGYLLGQTAAHLLIDLIERPKSVDKKQIDIETYIVELDSC